MKYMIAGGGTGGHIFPAVAIAEALRKKVSGAAVLFIGTRYGMEKTLIPNMGYPLYTLPIRGWLGKKSWQKLALLWRLPASLTLSFFLLIRHRPRVVIGVGGYASAPLLWMAGLLRIPTMIQEQNAFPGLTNRVSARFARMACCGFEEAARFFRCPTIVTGNPVRASFSSMGSWSPDRKIILILGGSQGSAALNRIVPELLGKVIGPENKLSVVHQCGQKHVEAVSHAYRNAAFPYIYHLQELK